MKLVRMTAAAGLTALLGLHMGSADAAQTGKASYYKHGHRTASGERYNPHDYTAAHRSLPFGTRVLVTNLKTGKSVIVRINDRGPHLKGRVIDLSLGAAQVVGLTAVGTASVKVVPLRKDMATAAAVTPAVTAAAAEIAVAAAPAPEPVPTAPVKVSAKAAAKPQAQVKLASMLPKKLPPPGEGVVLVPPADPQTALQDDAPGVAASLQ